MDVPKIKSVKEILEETKEPLVKQVKTSEPKRDENGRLLKGHTANPNGRPKKFTFHDYITEEEIKKLLKTAKSQANEKSDLMKFLLEQTFGKAKQSIDLKGNLTLEDIMNEHWKKRQAKIESMSNDEFIKYDKTDNIPD